MPGGSREGAEADAGAATGADDEHREVTDPNVDAADGEDADSQLRAMRAVWLSMRDEAPPDAGLTALLAAARAKAEVMRPPTLWQRTLVMLRRPPVLALATVLVLLGGALLVGRRVLEEPEALRTAPVVQSRAAVAEVPPAGIGQVAGVASGSAAPMAPAEVQETSVVVRPAATGGGAVAAQAEDRRREVLTTPPRHRDSPAQPALTERATVTREHATRLAGAGDTAKGAAPEADAPSGTPSGPGPGPGATPTPTRRMRGGSLAGESRRPDASTVGRTADEVPEAPSPTPADESPVVTQPSANAGSGKDAGSTDVDGKPTDDTLAALYKKCESAAQRGDCAEAKRVMERINRTDRDYRRRAAKVPAMAKCLAQ